MLIKIKKTFAQPGRPFYAGRVYEVADDEAARMIELGEAAEADAADAEGDVVKAASAATQRAAASRKGK